MEERESVSFKKMRIEIESVSAEIRQSKLRLIAQLLAASLLLILWIDTVAGIKIGYSSSSILFVLMAPIFANTFAWLMWAYWMVMAHFPQMGSFEFKSHDSLEQYDFLRYMLRRQRSVELPIDIATAFQFVSMGLSFVIQVL